MAPVAITVTSFGYGHSSAPEADLTVDARRRLRDPHVDPAMRQLTGHDEVVRNRVLATPGAEVLALNIVATAWDFYRHTGQPITIAIGCAGGRHRSVVLAETIGDELRAYGIAAVVTHRDVDKPVLASHP